MGESASGGAPGVSVVIPAFNSEAFLERTLDSVVEQRWPLLEVVVVDDGSTDGTNTIVERYSVEHPGVFRYVRQENAGPATARNRGVLEAKHPFVALLDHDDRWMSNKLSLQMGVMLRDPHLAACATGIIFRVVGEPPLEGVISDWNDAPAAVLARLLMQNCILTSSVVAKRDALIDAGLFDTSLWWGDEYDLWLRLAAKGFRIGYVPQALVDYTRGEANLSSHFLRRGDDPYITLMQRRFDAGDLPDEIQARRRWFLATRHLNNAVGYLEVHPRLAVVSLLRAGLTRPASIRPGWLKLLAKAGWLALRARSTSSPGALRRP